VHGWSFALWQRALSSFLKPLKPLTGRSYSRTGSDFGFLGPALMNVYLLYLSSVTSDLIPISTAQQQQAEKMRVYWKVRFIFIAS
jgi:hypothetical protein